MSHCHCRRRRRRRCLGLSRSEKKAGAKRDYKPSARIIDLNHTSSSSRFSTIVVVVARANATILSNSSRVSHTGNISISLLTERPPFEVIRSLWGQLIKLGERCPLCSMSLKRANLVRIDLMKSLIGNSKSWDDLKRTYLFWLENLRTHTHTKERPEFGCEHKESEMVGNTSSRDALARAANRVGQKGGEWMAKWKFNWR